MNAIPFLYVLVGTIFSIVWMGFALGAVLSKMGMDPKRAWIPVLRHVAAAEAGRVSRLAVMIARSVSTLGVTVLLIAFALRAIQGEQTSVLVGIVTLVGAVLYGLGALVGWIFWIIGSGTIGMRLNIAGGWTILAAASPHLWAAIVGWAKIGTPIPSDAIGRAASAGAAPAPTPHVDQPAPTAPAVVSVFGEGRPAVAQGTQAFDTTPFPAQAPIPPATPHPAAPTTASAAPEPSAPVNPPSGAPAANLDAPAPTGEPVRGLPSTPMPRDVPAPAPPSPYGQSHAEPPTTSELPTGNPGARETLPEPPPVDPTRPVSPYITAAPPGVPVVPAPEPEDDETVIEKVEPAEPAPMPPSQAASTADSAASETSASSATSASDDAAAAAARLSMLPPGWDGSGQRSDDVPAAAPEPALPPESPVDEVPEHTPQPATIQPPPPIEPPSAEPTAASAPSAPLEPTPPPSRPAPAGVWAAPGATPAVPVAPVPVAPPEAPAAGGDDAPQGSDDAAQGGDHAAEDGDDFTVIAQRRRDVWVLQVDGGDSYPLPDGEVSIGRLAVQSLGAGHLGIADATRTMSKRHAKLRLVDGAWMVSDLGSTNGTFVRGSDGREVEIVPGTEAVVEGALLLGDLEAQIVNQGSGRG